jgi:hypothetical protein
MCTETRAAVAAATPPAWLLQRPLHGANADRLGSLARHAARLALRRPALQ